MIITKSTNNPSEKIIIIPIRLKSWKRVKWLGCNNLKFNSGLIMAVDYLKVAQASDLQGRDRFLYRALEILPAALSGGTLVALTLLSWLKPAGVAYFIIVFDVYLLR